MYENDIRVKHVPEFKRENVVLLAFNDTGLDTVLAAMIGNTHPGHRYVVDMLRPAPTLVLSHNQYLAPSWLTAGKQPIFADGT